MDNSSGVGVLDKAALVLTALESGPATLAGLVTATGLARPTAHRLAVALEHHRLVARDMQGRFVLGPRCGELASAAGEDRLLATAGPVLARLRDITGESAQLWRRQADSITPPIPPPHSRASAAAAGPSQWANASKAWPQSPPQCVPPRAKSLRRCRSQAPSSASPANPAACTPRPFWPPPNASPKPFGGRLLPTNAAGVEIPG